MAEAFKKSDIEILVATMDRDTLDFLGPMFPFKHFSEFNILVVNQTTEVRILSSEYPSVRVINAFERGLSKSRNLALQNATGAIGLLTDDDVVFKPDFDTKVLQGFNRFSTAAVVKFCAATFDGPLFRKYPKQPLLKLNALHRLNTMSIEIGLNIGLIRASGIRFDTRFGLGSVFPLGEEPIFVNDLHSAGYQISFEPEVIVMHPTNKDSDNITLAQNYQIRGAYFKRIFSSAFPVWIGIQLMFHLKNGFIGPQQIAFCIKNALKGKQHYLSLSKR